MIYSYTFTDLTYVALFAFIRLFCQTDVTEDKF